MEKNNGKIIALAALIVAVIALAVGFASFTDALTIDGTATVKGANAFDDATNDLAYVSTSPECHITGTTTSTSTTPYTAGTASGDVWEGISVPLTTENPSVTCTATVKNKTQYVAYLRGIATQSGITCASSGANQTTNENNICGAVNVDVQVGSVATDKISFGSSAASKPDTTGSIAKSGDAGDEATVTVVITYDGQAVADENVVVTLPTITHSYSSSQTD